MNRRMINDFGNELDRMRIFLTSIIGPSSKNPIIALSGRWVLKLLATIASDVEHRDSKQAATIIHIMDRGILFCMVLVITA